jgi:hypothetical protein
VIPDFGAMGPSGACAAAGAHAHTKPIHASPVALTIPCVPLTVAIRIRICNVAFIM